VAKAFDGSLQLQPNLVSLLKLTWNPMLITTVFVLSIGFLQDIMEMLANVLNSFNKLSSFVNAILNMCIYFLCSCEG